MIAGDMSGVGDQLRLLMTSDNYHYARDGDAYWYALDRRTMKEISVEALR